MAFVEFEDVGGKRLLINAELVVSAEPTLGYPEKGGSSVPAVHLNMGRAYYYVRGSWDEVLEKLGRATDVYIERREEVEA